MSGELEAETVAPEAGQGDEPQAATCEGPPSSTQQEDAAPLTQDPAGPSAGCTEEAMVPAQEPDSEPASSEQPAEEAACSDAADAGSPQEAAPESPPSTAATDDQAVASAVTPLPEPAQAPAPEQHQELQPAQEEAAASEYLVPGMRALTVEVDEGGGLPCRMVRVEIDATTVASKPFMGGYKHRGSGATYHHAAQQTSKAPKYNAEAEPKRERTTQTVDVSTRSAQTLREQGTQMAKRGLHLDTSGDRALAARPYTTAAEVLAVREAAARTIQRWCRGWQGRTCARALAGHRAERLHFKEEQEGSLKQSAADTRKREVQRRMQPRSAADFATLTGEVDAWRAREAAAIKQAGLTHQEEQASLQLLLAKETRLLQTIDRLRVTARAENRDARDRGQLAAMASPKTWQLRNGGKVQVHTPATLHAQELSQLHGGLCLPDLPLDERLDVLLHVKWAVKGAGECGLTREITDLIEREADMLSRGRDAGTLAGLRKRLAARFLAFCQAPEFNPEAARFKVAAAAAARETFAYSHVERERARAAPVPIGTGSIKAC